LVFRELFDEHVRAVYNLAFRLTGSWSVAEDAVSLTFLEAWRLRERVSADPDAGPLRAWLLGITTNVARNLRRASRRHEDAMSRLPRAQSVPGPADVVCARLDDRDQVARVMAALATLRRPEREVLALCVWSGLDYAEAVQALGVPVGTVRSRLSRARRRLAALAPPDEPRPGRELTPRPGQVQHDRTTAVRLAQENAR
jgi:RNA polymerase sigma-70 factor (ECF subfamily)